MAAGLVAGVAACSGPAHPPVSDDQLACAAATETGRLIGRGELGPPGASEDERAAALLREIATLQFALASLSPADEEVAAAADGVERTRDPADAVDATVRLSATCERVEVPIELDGEEHTTAACTQLRAVAALLANGDAPAGGDDAAAADGGTAAVARLGFTARYADARIDELDETLGEQVETLVATMDADDPAAAERALDAAVRRCDQLRDGS